MTWNPQIRIYAANGVTLLYTFQYVTSTNIPQSPVESVEHTNIRAKGSLIVSGGEQAWDINIDFVLVGTDYQDITSKIESLESGIPTLTPMVLRFDKTPTTSFEYHVKRVVPIVYDPSLRISLQRGTVILRGNSW